MSEKIKKPPITKYLDPSCAAKAVDLANLCRRLIAEWKYINDKPVGNFVKVFKDCNATKSPDVFRVIHQWLEATGMPITLEMMPFLYELPITKYSVTCESRSTLYDVDAKDFKGSEGENLTPDELLEIYLRLTMFGSCAFLVTAVGQLVEDFRKRKYAGFLLPNGKVVPFESMHLASFSFCPEELHLIDYYQLPKGVTVPQPNVVIEGLGDFGVNGFVSDHVVMAFNLPEKDDQGNLGRLLIFDPTCAQFGMKGANGEVFYWGYYEDYADAFPAKKLFCEGKVFRNYNSREKMPAVVFPMYITPLKKAALSSMNSDSCGYCGEVERKKNPKIKLKKCSKCKKAFFCDALCQKLARKSHKLECKSN